ncbi:MAG: hypothetical protein RKL24_01375 [Defluviicoccus sp.]|nr:hypothetical protein [Defluviicoccus sp.]
MKLMTNSDQITKANGTCWGLLSVCMEQLSIYLMQRNYSPATPNGVVDIELMPPMGNLVAFSGQVGCPLFGCAPFVKPFGIAKPMSNQVVAHGKLRPEVLNGVITDRQSLAVWDADAFQSDSEKLPFDITPLGDGAAKFMLEGDDFFASIHGAATMTPNEPVEKPVSKTVR